MAFKAIKLFFILKLQNEHSKKSNPDFDIYRNTLIFIQNL